MFDTVALSNDFTKSVKLLGTFKQLTTFAASSSFLKFLFFVCSSSSQDFAQQKARCKGNVLYLSSSFIFTPSYWSTSSLLLLSLLLLKLHLFLCGACLSLYYVLGNVAAHVAQVDTELLYMKELLVLKPMGFSPAANADHWSELISPC